LFSEPQNDQPARPKERDQEQSVYRDQDDRVHAGERFVRADEVLSSAPPPFMIAALGDDRAST